MHTLPVALFIWAVCHIGSVHGYVRPRQDPSGVSAAQPAIETPGFSFNKIAEFTTCTPASNNLLTLFITNDGVIRLPTGTFATPDPRAMHRRDVTTQQINPDPINPLVRDFTWNSVNVTAGWYELTAKLNLPGYIQESVAFYVQNGTDVSCIAAPSSSSSSTPADPTSSGTSSGSPTTTGVAETSGVTLPVTSGASKVNRGAIAGGVIGGLAVVAAVIAAYFYFRYASASTASGGSTGRRAPRKWAGLSSPTPRPGPTPRPSRSAGAASDRHHSQSDSIGPMLSSRDSNVYVIGTVGIDSRPSRIHDTLEEEDEVNSYFSPSQEKIASPSQPRSPFSESGHGHDIDDAVPLDYIAPLPGTTSGGGVTRNSSTSTSSRPRSAPELAVRLPDDDGRRPVQRRPGRTPQPSLVAGHDSMAFTAPAFASGTSQSESPVRRPSVSPAEGAPCRSTTPPTPRSPPPRRPCPRRCRPTLDSDSSREGSLRGGAGAVLPRLGHKGSFGDGRPVHYLIPDMPPPPRD
ncbi:hypothetical protein B0H14DRAFT_2729625 [Mycena olivaceomarginata]|nr:hypothetical protein B0H14DRAFT_2729625 [Mycena olivaceomarginata]